MYTISAFELAEFALEHEWVEIDKSDADDLKESDDFIRYLTPGGQAILVRFTKDGSIKEIFTK